MSDRVQKEQEIQQKKNGQPQVLLDQKFEQSSEQSFQQKLEQKRGQNIQQKPLQKDHLILGKYKLGMEIGRGSSGIVYGVQDKLGNDIADLALKIIKMIQMDQKQRNYVRDEIQLLKKNQSQYVVKLYGIEYNKDKEQLYMVMEKCESSLQEIYWQDIINDQQRTKYAYDLIKGVAFIHSQKICHRDLKLQNILLKGNQIKIADFGISKKMEKLFTTFIGTRQYMAPQLYTKKFYTQKVDSWALGVILLQLFCRKRINQLCERYAGTLQQQFPSDTHLNEVKNNFIRKIIRNFLEKQEEKRWSIIEVAEKIIKKQKKGKKIEQSQQQQIYDSEETRQPIQIQ